MSAASDFLEGEWIKYAFTATAMTARPTAWKVRLHTADPTEAGTAAQVSGSGYVADGVAATFTQSASQVSNAGAITYATVVTTPYTVSHVSVWESAPGANCLFVGALAVPKTLAVGEAISFAIGELILSDA